MPEISRFYGIIIKMFFKPKEHEPGHVHVLYGEWLAAHQDELIKMWKEQIIRKLPPL